MWHKWHIKQAYRQVVNLANPLEVEDTIAAHLWSCHSNLQPVSVSLIDLKDADHCIDSEFQSLSSLVDSGIDIV